MKQNYLECGKIINIHGFRGTVKLESWCDSPDILAGLESVYFLQKDGTYQPCRVLHASAFRQFVLMDLDGIDSEEKANALRQTVIYAAREDLPLEDGDHFIVDLIGLDVRHSDTGELLGKLIRVNTNTATDMYVVRTETGDYLVPAVPAFVTHVDVEDAVYIRPIPGLLDGGAENV
ncbi:MAG: 16S rRNA processing protein RimM [Clostridia bacterium]|nr:16S rRNA processing protein RimM [Clostridia bacterium]